MKPPVGMRVQRRAWTAPLTLSASLEAALPLAGVEAPLVGEAPQGAVGADVVEAVIVDAHVRQVRRHALDGARAPELEEPPVAGGVELQQRRAELKSLRPLGPAAGPIPPLDGEDGRAILGPPGAFGASIFSAEASNRASMLATSRDAGVSEVAAGIGVWGCGRRGSANGNSTCSGS